MRHVENKVYKKSEKITHVLSILLLLCIKFQRQILNKEGAVKKIKISNRSIVRNLSENSIFCYR
jgi:hypothetical protein